MMNALIGGMIIGVSVSLMLLFLGRVTGIIGIIGGALNPRAQDLGWRFAFVGGLFAGGVLIRLYDPTLISTHTNLMKTDYAIAGLLVGVGTLIGSGCTSGHGVCGLSRFCLRSLVATITFIAFGVLSVILFKMYRGAL